MVCNLYTVFGVVLTQKVHLSIAPFVSCCARVCMCVVQLFIGDGKKTETIQFQMRKIRKKEDKKTVAGSNSNKNDNDNDIAHTHNAN